MNQVHPPPDYPAVAYPNAGVVTVVTQQPLRSVRWQNTLCTSCGTAGVGFCLTTTFCSACAVCWLSTHTGEHCCVPICLGPIVTIEAARTKLRVMYGLEGDLCSDCLPLTCCGPCVMCQTKAEWDMYMQGKIF